MKIPALLFLTTITCVFAFTLNGEARTWTRAKDGKKIEADFVKSEGDKITINKGGKNMTLPISVFSKEDQKFISAQGKGEEKEKAKAGSKEMPKGPTTVVLSGTHLCCSGCEKRMKKALERYDDIKLEFDKGAGTVSFVGDTGQAVADALVKVSQAGFYGTTDHALLKMKKGTSSTKEVEEVEVIWVHLCCGKCIKAVKAAVKATPGADEHTAEKGKTSFRVTGKFKIGDLAKAMNEQGMSGLIREPTK